jgi:hypothetical protein
MLITNILNYQIMGHSIEQPIASKKEKVILYLMGIDKKWTRGQNNQWVEYSEVESKQEIAEVEIKTTKKWWQFWKKA